MLSGTTRRSWRAADFLAYQLTHMDKGFGSQALPGLAETCVGWAEVKFQLKVLLYILQLQKKKGNLSFFNVIPGAVSGG